MALPEGVTTAVVTAGVPVTYTGAPVKAFVSIEPSVFLVHTATGTPLVDFLEELSINEGVAGGFTLPHTDQAGFQDENGNAYTNWYYTARVSYSTPSKSKTKPPKIKVFQLATGQTVVDLDALPSGAPALPYTAPVATVTSVNGGTGAVTIIPGEPLPARLSEASLSATYAPTTGSTAYAAKSVETSKLDVTAAATTYRAKAEAQLNILDYGVVRGTTATQTVAIKAALDSQPGRTFYFPPGDYRLDTGLVIQQANSLRLDDDARIYAGAAMTTMITYLQSAAGYAEDKSITGGLLDGNLNAQRILSIGKVIRFTLTRTNFKDGINRGLVTEAGLGAELFAYDLRFYNTGISNVTDNIAIEANMGDSHFRDIVTRNWTVAVKDTAANRWDRIHPWIDQDAGAVTQMTSRYPTSIGFDITGSSDLVACVSDTMRTAYKFRTNGTGTTPLTRLHNCRAMWADNPILPTALATANPAYVFDNSDGVGVLSDRFTANGPATAAATFLLGAATNMTTRNTYSYGYIKGYTGAVSSNLSYVNGVVQGTFTFTPTFTGTTGVGTHTYTAQTGHMIVTGDTVTYFVRIAGTLDTTTAFAGNWRIGGIPLPQGSNTIRRGAGTIGDSVGFPIASAVIYEGQSAQIALLKMVDPTGTTAIDIPGNSIRGKTVDISVAVTVTHFTS
jgi:hypothetical protein